MFENMVLRRIFGPMRDEVTEEWRKLHNEELMICTAHTILLRLDAPRGTYGGEERCIQGFGGETSRKETTWET